MNVRKRKKMEKKKKSYRKSKKFHIQYRRSAYKEYRKSTTNMKKEKRK